MTANATLLWDDLRLVLAVARGQGLAPAAAALGVNHSTVFRRLAALERALGQKLFERSGALYRPTTAGEQAARAAERMEAEALALDRTLTGRDHRLSGLLRVTSSETLAHRMLTRQLAAFRTEHPGIVVELVIDNRMLSLSKREADVALRPVRPNQGDLFGRKLADIAWTVYGSRDYLKRHGTPRKAEDLARHALIGWDEAATRIRAADWLARQAPAGAVVYRSGSLINQLAAARAGIGLAVLPCYLADSEPDVARALPPIPALARELWLITHKDLKDTARVRAFMSVVGDGLARERAVFEGRASATAEPSRRRP